MQIKSYNPAVDPNTIHGSVQAPSDANAYGANTSGSKILQAGLNDVQKQWQAYIDDQISLSVVDASNKYQQDMNSLLNDPEKGLLNQQDVNALDVVQKYQDGEAKIRQDALALLPNYKKAHDTFLKMADETNVRNAGNVMQYQYRKDMEHRDSTYDTFARNATDALVETKNWDGIYQAFNRLQATGYALYGNIYGKDKVDDMIRQRCTDLANNVLLNLTASGNASDYDKALSMVEKISPFVDDTQLTKIRASLQQRKHDNGLLSLAKEAQQKYPNDPKKQADYIREHSQRTIVTGGSNTGNEIVDYFVDAAKEFKVDPRKYLSMGMRETGGDTVENMYMDKNGGYAQITPETAQYYDLDTKFPGWNTDPKQNIRAGAYILSQKIKEQGGDEWAGVRAYNGAGPAADSYLARVQENYNSLENYDLSGGNGAGSYENNLIQGFQNAPDIPANGPNGCAEEALSMLSWANPWAQDAYQKGLFNVKEMADYAEKCKIQKIAYNPQNLSVGDLVIYKTDEGDYGHTVVYDGHGGYYGNSSSANDHSGGKVHGNDINIPGMTPEYILKTGAGETGGTMGTQVVQVYDEGEIQKAIGMAANYDAQEKRAEQAANDALVQQGMMEMQQLHQSGVEDPAAYLAIAEKYGYNNPDVYASLKTHIGMYATVTRAGGGSSSGSGGSAGSSGRGSRGGGKTSSEMMVILKSMYGQNGINTYKDMIDYCGSRNIVLSPSQMVSLQKAAKEYQTGTGEYSPLYDISAEQIENATGINKAEFMGNMPVIKQFIRTKAVEYRNQTGKEPSMDMLIQFAANAVTPNENNGGYSQAQLRAAGIDNIIVGDDGYCTVTDWYGNSYTIDKWSVQQIVTGQKTLDEVIYEAQNASSVTDDSGSSDDSDDGSYINSDDVAGTTEAAVATFENNQDEYVYGGNFYTM